MEIYATSSQGVVTIQGVVSDMTLDTYPNGTLTPVVGTGFVVVYAGQDYIVTNYHAVDGYNIQVNRDGRGRVKGAPSSRNEVEDQAPLGRTSSKITVMLSNHMEPTSVECQPNCLEADTS